MSDPTMPARGRSELSTDTHTGVGATVGTYSWREFLTDYGYADDIEDLYHSVEQDRERKAQQSGFLAVVRPRETPRLTPQGSDWDRVTIDPIEYLGYHPDETEPTVQAAIHTAARLQASVTDWLRDTPVSQGTYTWEHFKVEYYYDARGLRPRDSEGDVIPFDPATFLGFEPDATEKLFASAMSFAGDIKQLENDRTVNVDPELDEDAFFSTVEGHTTLVNRYDLEQAVPMQKKPFLYEVERYWVAKPHAFVIILHSVTENEAKYFLISPHLNPIETRLKEYLTGKLRTTIKYADDIVIQASVEERVDIIERELNQLLSRYGLFASPAGTDDGLMSELRRAILREDPGVPTVSAGLEGLAARPMPAILAEDPDQLTEYQVSKLEYLLARDFVGYGRIDGIKHDASVEDISCDGYNSPVFVYHSEYEQLITNINHGEGELDRFVVKLAQRSGKSISKRHPQVDATLPDGSRAQLTLGYEVSDHGTNYTIRQFNDVPFTPVDLINWHTFSLDEIAYLWLAIESNKSILFAGGTASGKTTSLNAMSLFIPSKAKIVSIEDTREVELPQRNWIASITRPAFSQDDAGDVDEFDLLEAALRQRPEYIVMGEVRGEEGRTLFQVMSTGHTTLTTFHADTVGEVLKRFTTAPINVSKTMFTALDLVSVQTQTRVKGQKIRRNKVITEINRYDTERDEINVRDIHQWYPESDEFSLGGESALLEDIKFDRGWSTVELEDEMMKRRVVLAYLISHGLNEYAQVAATLQAFINDPDTVLALIARGRLEESLEDLRGMESVLIDIDPEKEMLVPRPEPTQDTLDQAEALLEQAEDTLFTTYRRLTPSPLVEALPAVTPEPPVEAVPGAGRKYRAVAHRDSDADPRVGTDGGRPEDDTESSSEEGPTDASQSADTGGTADTSVGDESPREHTE